MALKKPELIVLVKILVIVLVIVGIGFIISLISNAIFKSKINNFDKIDSDLQTCYGNLSDKVKELGILEHKKGILINALTTNKETLSEDINNLKLELGSCQELLQDTNNTIKEKNQLILDLQSQLIKCENYSETLAKLEDKLITCNTNLNEARRLKDSDVINFFGLILTVKEIEVVEIVSVMFIFLLISIPLSISFKLPNGFVFGWALSALITALIAYIIEINSINIPLMANALWYLIFFIILLFVFGLIFKNWD